MSISTASVTLDLIREPDIDCPGDFISYNCSIFSNSETVLLTWRVTFPDFPMMPFTITYDEQSLVDNGNNDYISLNTGYSSTLLTDYVQDEYIKSILVFELSSNITFNDTKVECESADLDNMTTYLSINSSGKILH